jgi:hypothetical protein
MTLTKGEKRCPSPPLPPPPRIEREDAGGLIGVIGIGLFVALLAFLILREVLG